MEVIKEIATIEIKRSFVISQFIRKHNLGRRRYLPKLNPSEFKDRLEKIKKLVLEFPESKLDEVIAKEYKKRLRAYNSVKWYIGTVFPDEIGVWKGSGGLPVSWTEESLGQTAAKVSQALKSKDSSVAKRAKRAIPRMTEHLEQIEKEKYLYPIILPGGTMGRKGLHKMKGDIDDGCMRSLALVCSGRKSLKAYIGVSQHKMKK